VARIEPGLCHWVAGRESGGVRAKVAEWVRDMLALSQAPAEVKELVQERPEAIRHARYLVAVGGREARRELTPGDPRQGLSQPQVLPRRPGAAAGGVGGRGAGPRRGGRRWSSPSRSRRWGLRPTLVVPEPGLEAAAAGAKPQVRTRSTVQALLWRSMADWSGVSLGRGARGGPAASRRRCGRVNPRHPPGRWTMSSPSCLPRNSRRPPARRTPGLFRAQRAEPES